MAITAFLCCVCQARSGLYPVLCRGVPCCIVPSDRLLLIGRDGLPPPCQLWSTVRRGRDAVPPGPLGAALASNWEPHVD